MIKSALQLQSNLGSSKAWATFQSVEADYRATPNICTAAMQKLCS